MEERDVSQGALSVGTGPKGRQWNSRMKLLPPTHTSTSTSRLLYRSQSLWLAAQAIACMRPAFCDEERTPSPTNRLVTWPGEARGRAGGG